VVSWTPLLSWNSSQARSEVKRHQGRFCLSANEDFTVLICNTVVLRR
jgi:hypothetical protein